MSIYDYDVVDALKEAKERLERFNSTKAKKWRLLEHIDKNIEAYTEACYVYDRVNSLEDSASAIAPLVDNLSKSNAKSLDSLVNKVDTSLNVFYGRVCRRIETITKLCVSIDDFIAGRETPKKRSNTRREEMYAFLDALWAPINAGTADYTLCHVDVDWKRYVVDYTKNGERLSHAF